MLVEQIRNAIDELEPLAKIWLYGSRARGDHSKESDWDFLVLLNKNVDEPMKSRIRDRIYDIELESGELISSIIFSIDQWNSDLFKSLPFYKNVIKDRIEL
jgi:uncharacterized protein